MVQAELISSHQSCGEQRKRGFQAILPTQEEGAADKHPNMHFMQLVGREQVMRALNLIYPIVERSR